MARHRWIWVGAVAAVGLAGALLWCGDLLGSERIFLRGFKQEGEFELWAQRGAQPFRLVRIYHVTAASGQPGPKRREGDRQVPEGFYEVDRFNPHSLFHLSLGLNYPNASDRLRSDPAEPGSDIFVHGGAVSIGCLPLGDVGIEEVYRRAERSRQPIEVHLFPARMEGPAWEQLQKSHPELVPFWEELQPGYDAFQRTHRLPKITVGAGGRYLVRP